MIVSAALVLSVVSGALAFKTPSLKKFVCGTANTCIRPDTKDYQEVQSGGTQITGELSTSSLIGHDCSECSRSFQVIVEN